MKQAIKYCFSVIVAVLMIGFIPCHANAAFVNYQVIPMPQQIDFAMDAAPFKLSNDTKIIYPKGNIKMKRNAEFLADFIKSLTGISVQLSTAKSIKTNAIVLTCDLKHDNKEAYQLTIHNDKIAINGASEAGVFYGMQTLRKSLPMCNSKEIILPAARISDFPRFSYRGAMLDVCRHFFNKEEVKQFIDMLALHNLNNFHWHISDDQGWRIEIKSHPKLTQIGSMRKESVIGRKPGKWDGVPVSGFFTQKDAKEIVTYAAERYINVIPEIDMPGHMRAALAAYPELGCTGGPYDVWTEWGVTEEVLCAGNDKTLKFISDVLNEIMDIFPSAYIHAGGDECPKTRWQKCLKCQQRIKNEGIVGDEKLTAEQHLQSYIMRHANNVISSRNRTMIGWDEVLEGNVGKDIVVMSWRGNAGGIEGAKKKHKVIMAPNSHMYFDFYQSKDIQFEPFAIGGFTPVEKVYNLEPVPKELSAEEAKYIIGVQANLWTEYILDFKQVQYMELPRMAALAEIQWSDAKSKDFNKFIKRIPALIEVYDNCGYNYAKHLFDITAKYAADVNSKSLNVDLATLEGGEIFYTLDGSEPTATSSRYSAPIKISSDAILKAVVIRKSGNSRVLCDTISVNKATFHNIKLLTPTAPRYTFDGAMTLVDGINGNGNYRTGRWLGFNGNDMEAVIDLEKPVKLTSAGFSCVIFQCDGVFDSKGIEVLASNDGEKFDIIASDTYPEMDKKLEFGVVNHTITFPEIEARYIKIRIKAESELPLWHPLSGSAAFLFVDEIILN